ncbi:hypothetical protein TNCV_162301 [Trichonephila clavipes]|nr:hypothetical protein TNCV_162301 [Trichonephila clavipes]
MDLKPHHKGPQATIKKVESLILKENLPIQRFIASKLEISFFTICEWIINVYVSRGSSAGIMRMQNNRWISSRTARSVKSVSW